MQLSGYLELLKKRSDNKRVSRAHQLAGLEVAELLGDKTHASLYMKLAKLHGSARVLAIAKDVANRASVRHRAAYFMRIVQSELGFKNPAASTQSPKKKKRNNA